MNYIRCDFKRRNNRLTFHVANIVLITDAAISGTVLMNDMLTYVYVACRRVIQKKDCNNYLNGRSHHYIMFYQIKKALYPIKV